MTLCYLQKKSNYWCQRNHSQENEPFPYSLCSFRFERYYRLSRVQVRTQHLHFYRIFHIFINSFLSSDENFGGRNLWHPLENVNNMYLYFACTRRFTDLFDYVVIMVSVIRQGGTYSMISYSYISSIVRSSIISIFATVSHWLWIKYSLRQIHCQVISISNEKLISI